MSTFRLYHITERYIQYLHNVDYRVQYNKGQRRPYVGIVLSVSGVDYYVPLESPKPNHANIKASSPILKMDGGKLGILGFNNMIPVPKSELLDFDVQAVADAKYQALLFKQIAFCEKNRDAIYNRAQRTYRMAAFEKIPAYTKVCCDFFLLEQALVHFEP